MDSLRFIAVAALCAMGCAEDGPGLVDERCFPMGEAPQTIEDAIERLNALPDESLGCFVATLPRPLRMTATNSQFSAQPAAGFARPRVFLHSDGLVLSIALGGEGQHLLEFGEWVDERNTIKGEVDFPLETPLAPSAPYVGVERGSGRTGTSCAICHGSEVAIEGRPGAFSSLALQPRPREVVNLEYLRSLVDSCDAVEDVHGCTLLHAIFDYGEVVHEDFDDDVATL